MTGGFLRVPNMRPNHCWTVTHVSILAMLLLTLNADNEDSTCEFQITVRRNTAVKAVLGENFSINCPVIYCNYSPSAVSWYKAEKTPVPVNVSNSSHIKTEWKSFNSSVGISYLIFQNALMSDSGAYHCQGQDTVSHSINVLVIVRDDEHTNVTQRSETNTPTKPPDPEKQKWLYMYTAAGIVSFVIIVIIISFASMQGCKGKSKKGMHTENQYMAIPMVEQRIPHGGLQLSPGESPAAPPPRGSTRRQTQPSKPNESPLSRSNECPYGKVKGDRERHRTVVEHEGGSVVYAALNHHVTPGAAAQPRRQQEESTEYAAIRIKDPTPSRH